MTAAPLPARKTLKHHATWRSSSGESTRHRWRRFVEPDAIDGIEDRRGRQSANWPSTGSNNQHGAGQQNRLHSCCRLRRPAPDVREGAVKTGDGLHTICRQVGVVSGAMSAVIEGLLGKFSTPLEANLEVLAACAVVQVKPTPKAEEDRLAAVSRNSQSPGGKYRDDCPSEKISGVSNYQSCDWTAGRCSARIARRYQP